MKTVFSGCWTDVNQMIHQSYRHSHLALLQIIIKLFVLHVFLHLSPDEYPAHVDDLIHCQGQTVDRMTEFLLCGREIKRKTQVLQSVKTNPFTTM